MEPGREADALECGVERPLHYVRVDECGQHLFGELVSVGEIDDLDRAAVDRVAEQQELEIVVVGVGVHTGFRQVHRREGLDVNEEFTHARQLLENNGGL
ncbi:hypothetical protein [Corynebacterium aurimucosum]|uniref:hypothetical protein n=1 Tax=Corynebacterium aurimucosum TaxID=169292 RepID=UPI0021CAFEB3|nr:hypothetical protein [Corynebacterium aurimucosum]